MTSTELWFKDYWGPKSPCLVVKEWMDEQENHKKERWYIFYFIFPPRVIESYQIQHQRGAFDLTRNPLIRYKVS